MSRFSLIVLAAVLLLSLPIWTAAHAASPPHRRPPALYDYEPWRGGPARPAAKRLLLADQPEPPFLSTLVVDPDIITPSDPTHFQDITAVGRGQRTMFDYRVFEWITVNAYLFNVQFDDGLTTEIQVNSEFGRSAARVEANKYGRAIGQLPTVLRTHVEAVSIHKGEGWGGAYNNIIIHTDDDYFDEESVFFPLMEELLVFCAVDASLAIVDASLATDPDWIAAQTADGNFISTYARDYEELVDLSESFLSYMAVRYRTARISSYYEQTILKTIPNRIAYFDALFADQFPITTEDLAASSHLAIANLEPNTAAWFYTPVSFSPDGTLLAIADTSEVSLWNVAKRQKVATLEPDDVVYSVSFSPDGTLLAIADTGADAGKVSLWDVAKRQKVATLNIADVVYSVSFSPDGTLLAIADAGKVSLWDVAERQTATLDPDGLSGSMSFSPDGTLLAAADLDEVSLWDVAKRQKVATLRPHSEQGAVLFSPDGTLLATARELWDTSEWYDRGTTADEGAVEVDLPRVFFGASADTVSEGTRRLEIAVLLSQATDEPVSVRYATASRTARAAEDYRAKIGTLVIPAGSIEETIRISLIDDSEVEGEEYFVLILKETGLENAVLGDPSRATITITDNDSAAKVSAFPNPFNGLVQIAYAIPVAGETVLDIYNVLGQRVQSMAEGYRQPGVYQATWDAKDEQGQAVSAGLYFVRMRHEKGVLTHRLLYLP